MTELEMSKKLCCFVDNVAKNLNFMNFTSHNFSKSEINVLKIIMDNYSNDMHINMSQTSKLLNISKPALTQTTTRLVFKGMIRRYHIKGDRKNVYLKPTSKGINIYTQIKEALEKMYLDFVEKIGIEDCQILMGILTKFIESSKDIREGKENA